MRAIGGGTGCYRVDLELKDLPFVIFGALGELHLHYIHLALLILSLYAFGVFKRAVWMFCITPGVFNRNVVLVQLHKINKVCGRKANEFCDNTSNKMERSK